MNKSPFLFLLPVSTGSKPAVSPSACSNKGSALNGIVKMIKYPEMIVLSMSLSCFSTACYSSTPTLSLHCFVAHVLPPLTSEQSELIFSQPAVLIWIWLSFHMLYFPNYSTSKESKKPKYLECGSRDNYLLLLL